MKKHLYLAFFLISLTVFAQNKDIVVVMDKSGSMIGERYLSANYASQLTLGLLDKRDGFTIIDPDPAIVESHNLNQKEYAIDKIQRTECNGGDDFEGVLKGLELLSKSNKTEKWLIIFADGEWGIDEAAEPIFRDYVEKKGIHIIFLNVSNPTTPLAVFCRKFPSVEVIQTPSNATAIRENLERIASRIIATDFSGLRVSYAGKALTVRSKFPLSKLIFLEQDAKPVAQLPIPTGLTCNGAIEILEKPVNVSNFMVDGAKDHENALISGKIAHLYHNNKGNIFEANSPIVINIANADPNKIKLFPVVALKLNATLEGNFKNVSGTNYTVCSDQSSIKVKAAIGDFMGKTLSARELMGSTVLLKANGKEIEMSIEGNLFVAELPLSADVINFTITANYPEYFNLSSPVFSVSKVKCVEPPKQTIKLPREEPGMNMDFDAMSIEELRNKARSVMITPIISDIDANGKATNRRTEKAEKYNIKFESEGGIQFEVVTSMGKWIVKPYTNGFCDCFTFRDEYKGKIIMSDSAGVALTQSNWSIRIKDKMPWYIRCKWVLIFGFLSLFALWFLYRIITRPRFPRRAIIKQIKINNELGGEPTEKTFKLRNGPLKKYFIPFKAETYTIGQIKFIANNKSSIFISGKSINDSMRLGTVKLAKKSADRLMQQNAKLIVSNPPKEETYTFTIQGKNQINIKNKKF